MISVFVGPINSLTTALTFRAVRAQGAVVGERSLARPLSGSSKTRWPDAEPVETRRSVCRNPVPPKARACANDMFVAFGRCRRQRRCHPLQCSVANTTQLSRIFTTENVYG